MSAPDHPWILKSREILSDGAWHDGVALVREMEKTITPGIAVRRAERDRARAIARRHDGEQRDGRVDRDMAALIRSGKRSLVRAMINNRIRDGGWEVDVWPIPHDGWRIGGWKVRDLRPLRHSVTALARQFGIPRDRALDIIAMDPPMETKDVGRVTYVTDCPEFERRLRALQDTVSRPPGTSRREKHQARAAARAALTQGDLRVHSGITGRTAAQLRNEHPELPWQHVGRAYLLPASHLAQWDTIVEEHRAASIERRSAASRKWRTEKSGDGDDQEGSPTPTFRDAQLTDAFRAYMAGDAGMRDAVYCGFRRAFHEADQQAGDQP